MKHLIYIILLAAIAGCSNPTKTTEKSMDNPFLHELNVPVDYANVSANDIEDYANYTLKNVADRIESIKTEKTPTFKNVLVALDDIHNEISTASKNCFMLYWVSPDSLSRVKGFAGYQLLDSLSTAIYSNKDIYKKIQNFNASPSYIELKGPRKNLVDDMIIKFNQSGVNLEEDKLVKFKELSKEISELSSNYSMNMNASSEKLILDEQGAQGLSENFKNTYKTADGLYEIPIISATQRPVMNNADNEKTRKDYYFKYYII